MKAVLIYLNGEKSLHDLTESAIYSGGHYLGKMGKLNPLHPLAVVVDVGHKHGARCVFIFSEGESHPTVSMGNLPVYREVPWVMAG